MQTYKIHICTHLDDLLAEYIAESREFCLIVVFLWQCQVHIILLLFEFLWSAQIPCKTWKKMLKQRGLSGTWQTCFGSFTGPGKSFAWHRANLDQMMIAVWCLTEAWRPNGDCLVMSYSWSCFQAWLAPRAKGENSPSRSYQVSRGWLQTTSNIEIELFSLGNDRKKFRQRFSGLPDSAKAKSINGILLVGFPHTYE